ncbi:MAG: DUF2304 domain-containing protein [Solirubrobacterales bacterium]
MTTATLTALAALIEESKLSGKAQILAVVVTVLLLALVIDLVRRRRLVERYALLWMLAASFLVVLAVWNGGLNFIADIAGIKSPPNALFLLGLAVIFGLLLNFSIAFSKLSEETKILAQEVARLDREQRRVRRGGLIVAETNGEGSSAERTGAGRPGADEPTT